MASTEPIGALWVVQPVAAHGRNRSTGTDRSITDSETGGCREARDAREIARHWVDDGATARDEGARPTEEDAFRLSVHVSVCIRAVGPHCHAFGCRRTRDTLEQVSSETERLGCAEFAGPRCSAIRRRDIKGKASEGWSDEEHDPGGATASRRRRRSSSTDRRCRRALLSLPGDFRTAQFAPPFVVVMTRLLLRRHTPSAHGTARGDGRTRDPQRRIRETRGRSWSVQVTPPLVVAATAGAFCAV